MATDDNDQIEDSNIAIVDVPMLANSTISEVEQAATLLCADEPETEMQSWLNLSAVLTARVRLIRQQIEEVAVKWVETYGPIVVGDLQYTVGYRKEVKCLDRQRTLDLILESSAGDLAAIVDHLRSDPYKYGSVRAAIGDANFNQVFKTESKPKLVCGIPQVELIATNTRFLPVRKSKMRQTKSDGIQSAASKAG